MIVCENLLTRLWYLPLVTLVQLTVYFYPSHAAKEIRPASPKTAWIFISHHILRSYIRKTSGHFGRILQSQTAVVTCRYCVSDCIYDFLSGLPSPGSHIRIHPELVMKRCHQHMTSAVWRPRGRPSASMHGWPLTGTCTVDITIKRRTHSGDGKCRPCLT